MLRFTLCTFGLGAILLSIGLFESSVFCVILGISFIIASFAFIMFRVSGDSSESIEKEKSSAESKKEEQNSNDKGGSSENTYQSNAGADSNSEWWEYYSSTSDYAPIPPNKYESQERRKNIFNKTLYSSSAEKTTIYTSALSVVALFSWVMRKDGSVGKSEMEVVRMYFKKHPIYGDIFSSPPEDLLKDPVLNTERPAFYGYLDLLEYYNTCPKLLRYGLCCHYILMSDIYYEAALDLLKTLFQVAYSSDGVIDSEMEILYGIAKELKIRREDWNNFKYSYGSCKKSQNRQQKKKKNKFSDEYDNSQWKRSRQNRSEDANNQNDNRSKQQQKQGQQQKKSSTFGYKLTQAYNELGVLTTATESEIKEAYRNLVKKYHPDRLPPEATDQERKISADQFRLVKEAYDLIRLERGR